MSRLPKPSWFGEKSSERFSSLLHPEPDDIGWTMGLPCFIWDKFLNVVLNMQGLQRLFFPPCWRWEVLWYRTWPFHGFEMFISIFEPSWDWEVLYYIEHRTRTSQGDRRFMSVFVPSWNGEEHDKFLSKRPWRFDTYGTPWYTMRVYLFWLIRFKRRKQRVLPIRNNVLFKC